MIYECQTRGCHYLFLGSEHAGRCPDCGKRNLKVADASARAEFLRLQTEFSLPSDRQTG